MSVNVNLLFSLRRQFGRFSNEAGFWVLAAASLEGTLFFRVHFLLFQDMKTRSQCDHEGV